ncbi:HEAT repeat domain-containing protein [Dactylosporangium aurantiacum]|uniref:HEAT repeat domain-containing protein n=1 Tax=Dactylosporangium aurantiacum TaxID=35754 RepID=A0A9Q9MJJ9_9ACTN|nr:HEAT repeat domain-containing protein [Dactylosporangium aurantiacum]MDG6108645.1 HEAT repeat domain-containing protein [Dactylosporangium aurantiacum]UWZ59139.1 HEAT repeat domain-containing protein [Dactylosporangium aurantiacum]
MQPVAQVMHEALQADADRRWELVTQLHVSGGQEALDLADRLRHDPEPSHRELAADVLGQLGAGPGRAATDGPFHSAALTILLAMIEHEEHPDVLNSIAVGLGHIGDERSVEPLVRLRAHPDVDVRRGVVFGLLGRPQRPALDALISLSADPDDDVRDWATFGLARQTDADFPELRAALAARLGDDDPDTLTEAIHGLAVRGDQRALPQLLRHLTAPEPEGDRTVLVEALYALAAATGDPRLLPHLAAERDTYTRDTPDAEPPAELARALARYGTGPH